MYGVVMAPSGLIDAEATKAQRSAIRELRRQRPAIHWNSNDHCQCSEISRDESRRVSEHLNIDSRGLLICRTCGEVLNGSDPNVAMAQRPLRAANPWMALRHGGDSPHFVLEELSCPDCATLISVREVRREVGNAG